MKKLLIIVGPTASGKTEFAIGCAKLLNSEVISADSMQIYKTMNIGTAKAAPDEMCGIKHHMLDIAAADREYSVAEYKEAATSVIENLFLQNRTPVICGGTGLYINAVIYPLNFSDTEKNSHLRNALLAELNGNGPEYMHEKLRLLDEKSAEKIHFNDTKRLIRALEINLTCGKRVDLELQKPVYDYLMIGFSPSSRDALYNRINARVDKMFEAGLADEVRQLLSDGLTFDAQSMQAIGYKEFKDYFDGKIDETQLKELIKRHTRNYAKRQLTWFKKYPDAVWFERPCKEAYALVKNTFIR